MSDTKSSIVALNEVGQLITALQSGELRAQLRLIAGLAADCDIRCGCNTRDCACNGAVSSRFFDEVSLPEFERVQQARIADLKAQLARLEKGR